jgi:hypothetical protein
MALTPKSFIGRFLIFLKEIGGQSLISELLLAQLESADSRMS